jgi:hypothetical protein
LFESARSFVSQSERADHSDRVDRANRIARSGHDGFLCAALARANPNTDANGNGGANGYPFPNLDHGEHADR